jgi:hypothetical protein
MRPQTQTPTWSISQKAILAIGLVVWFGLSYVIGAGQLLTNALILAVPPIAVTAALPVAAFVGAYLVSARFKSFVLAQDIRILTALQH